MSARFDEYFDSLPEPFKNRIFDMDIDLENDKNEWKDIYGYPDYCVSKHGQIASIRSGVIHILSTWSNQYGHLYVQLRNENGSKKFLVHRLVAEAFVDNPNKLPIVRHLDDNPKNNYYKNLAWGTHLDNRHDCVEHNRDYKVGVYCKELDICFKSCTEAAAYLNVSKSLITSCCQGKIHSILNGLHLCYVDEIELKMNNEEKWLWKSGNEKRVVAINVDTGQKVIFRSRKEASTHLNIPDSYISNIIHGRSEQTRGWTFKDLEGKYE